MRIGILFCFLCFFTLECKAQVPIVRIKVAKANVREKPASDARVLSTVSKGEEFEVYSYEGDWYYIASGGSHGWIHYTSLEVVRKQGAASEPKPGDVDQFMRNRATKGGVLDFSQIYENEWSFLTQSSGAEYTINPYLGSRKGSIVRIWIKATESETESVISRIQYEFDCSSKEQRAISGVEYKSALVLAGGKTIYVAHSPTSWETPKAKFKSSFPETIGETFLKEACSL